MKTTRMLVAVVAIGLMASFSRQLAAQPQAPPPPAQYQVILRYEITAARDQHVVQYDAMIEHLKRLGFAFNPPLEQTPATDREDPSKNHLKGAIASKNLLQILANPSVVTVLALPPDLEYPPKDLDKPLRVRLELAGGFDAERERVLADQVKAVLAVFNFREAPGYDHHGYSRQPFARLAGTIPGGRLEILLKDLRSQPAGWFAPRVPPQDIPPPLRNVLPIRIIEVLTDTEPIAEVPLPQPRSPAFLEKISPDLWTIVNGKKSGDDTVRVELIYEGTLTAEDQGWRRELQQRAPGIFIEGRLGQVVCAVARIGQVKGLAELPAVSTLRLPHAASVVGDVNTILPGDNAKALSRTGLAGLHKHGYGGQGVRLAILDTDFAGWAELVKQGKLPRSTRLVDLTSEQNPDLEPAPRFGDLGKFGHGTLCACAAALAAPNAQLVLIRLDPISPYRIDEVVKYLRGETQSSAYVDRRRDELITARAQLNLLRSQVLDERRRILEDFTDETDVARDFRFLGQVYGWVFSPRSWSLARLAYVDKLEKALSERNRRFFQYVEGIRSLDGIMLVASPLVWNDGFALGASSPLSRAFDSIPHSAKPVSPVAVKAPLLWFQSAGNTRGQTWSGLFRDNDGNGFMEFVAPGHPLRKGQWSTELNFLAWQPYDKARIDDLPEGARLHVSLQWREPHDPDYYTPSGGEDFYRKPLADLRLSLLRQRDPLGKTLPADAFDLVAVTSGIPERLEHKPEGSIYELVLETTLDKAGHYALRVERPLGNQWVLAEDAPQKRLTFARGPALLPSGLRPVGVATLPLLEKHWELQPRLFVDVVDGQHRSGRPVFADFATDQGSVGIPGDARSVITVGAADWHDAPQIYSAGGPLAFAELAHKPTLMAYDSLQLGPPGSGGAVGTSIATSFSAGTVATLISAGMTPDSALQYLKQLNGRVLKVPTR